jgi:hypothetical protein
MLLPVEQCRSCGSSIIWAVTDSGKRMPVDARSHADGKLRLRVDSDGTVHVFYDTTTSPYPKFRAHFATCPDADGWRRR